MFDYGGGMESWEIEQLRRSVAMLPPGHAVGAMPREQALGLFDELEQCRSDSARYRALLAELRRVLDAFTPGDDPA